MHNPSFSYGNKGFTIGELMVVIAIIGVLAAVLFPQLSGYMERSKIVSLHAQYSDMKKMIDLSKIDHGIYPAVVCARSWIIGDPRNCDATNDPFVSYGGIYNKITPWGGNIVYDGTRVFFGGTGIDTYFMFDDDRPYMGTNDNGSIIPRTILDKFDKLYDDGDMSTGTIFGDAMPGTFAGTGELIVLIDMQ